MNKDFGDYLLEEYSNISQAHFKTIETITTFFKHYLLIMAIPITAVTLFFKQENVNVKIFTMVQPLIPWLFIIISWVGFLVMLYIINLRLDAILYARTINSIRKYFYDKLKIDMSDKVRLRVLPQSPYQPSYHEISYFGPVIFTFTIINTAYFCYGMSKIGIYPSAWLFLPIPLIYFSLHFFIYLWYAEHREDSYLKSHIIGIDIDGVLNDHRQHFCVLLEKNTGKKIDKEKIITIPVHECPGLGVTREDEQKVFNDPEYWTRMISIDNAAHVLKKIKNQFKLKIFIFSHRPWPNISTCSKEIRKDYLYLWKQSLKSFYKEARGNLKYFLFYPHCLSYQAFIKIMTKLWLKKHGFKFDRVNIEKGNENVEDPQGHFKNRFYIARKKKIKFFVEDDLEKAKKLSYICDVVFLLKQPYNCSGELPGNVIRVDSWDQIYKNIRAII